MSSTPKAAVERAEQEAEANRDLRVAYRSLITGLEDSKAEALRPESTILLDKLNQANQLFSRVKRAHESTLDAKVLLATADLSAQKAQRLKLDSGSFQVEDYLAKLKHRLSRVQGNPAGQVRPGLRGPEEAADAEGETRLRWSNLQDAVTKAFLTAPAIGFMLGPLQIVPKARVQKARQEKVVKEALVRPQELREQDISTGGNDTSRNVNFLFKLLEEVEQVDGVQVGYPLFDFFINPFSFSQSVENLFHLSFLVRDGRVQIQEDEEGSLIVATAEPPTELDYQGGEAESHQNIFHFHVALWRELVEAFGITKTTIPHRVPKTTGAADGKWYG